MQDKTISTVDYSCIVQCIAYFVAIVSQFVVTSTLSYFLLLLLHLVFLVYCGLDIPLRPHTDVNIDEMGGACV